MGWFRLDLRAHQVLRTSDHHLQKGDDPSKMPLTASPADRVTPVCWTPGGTSRDRASTRLQGLRRVRNVAAERARSLVRRPAPCARRLGGDDGVVGRAVRDRALRLPRLPARALRPREHGAGGLEHRARPAARLHAHRRASRPPGSGATSTRSWRSSRRCGSSRRARSRSPRCRSSPSRSARCPSSGSVDVISGSERLAALLALAYLAYPWLSWNAVDAIHPVTLAIPLFLYCVYFLDGERLWAAAPFAVLALATGELMGISLAALGVWYGLARRRRWAGLAIAVARRRRGRSSRSTSSSRRSRTARARTSGTTPRSAALRSGC